LAPGFWVLGDKGLLLGVGLGLALFIVARFSAPAVWHSGIVAIWLGDER